MTDAFSTKPHQRFGIPLEANDYPPADSALAQAIGLDCELDAVNTTPKIYLIDTDPEVQSAIAEIADEMDAAVECFEDADAFLQSYMPGGPGCVVSEFRLLGMNGVTLQETMRHQGLHVPIVFLTAHAETTLTVRAVKAGAITVLEKPFSRQDLWDALQIAFDVDNNFRRFDAKHSQVRGRLSQITPKEKAVLDLMIQGKANKTIARELSVSVRTVEARRHQIFKKVEAESVAELVKIVLTAGEA